MVKIRTGSDNHQLISQWKQSWLREISLLYYKSKQSMIMRKELLNLKNVFPSLVPSSRAQLLIFFTSSSLVVQGCEEWGSHFLLSSLAAIVMVHHFFLLFLDALSWRCTAITNELCLGQQWVYLRVNIASAVHERSFWHLLTKSTLIATTLPKPCHSYTIHLSLWQITV